MIRVERDPNEPQALADIRKVELARVRGIAMMMIPDGPTSDHIGDKYQIVKEKLWTDQYYKCAYCESLEQRKRNDAEHFRPKARANRLPGSSDKHGYWWLAWTWSNLLFVCRNCNQAPYKLDKFPLDLGSEALVPEHLPPGGERPLLLDPTEQNGIDHIQFRPLNRNLANGDVRQDWTPVPRHGSRRGDKTIEVFGLDRPDLISLYNAHVTNHVRPEVDVIKAAIQNEALDDIWYEWERALRRLLTASLPFVGLSHDALDHFISIETRRKWGLNLRVLPPSR